jgi:hypothetical protein
MSASRREALWKRTTARFVMTDLRPISTRSRVAFSRNSRQARLGLSSKVLACVTSSPDLA